MTVFHLPTVSPLRLCVHLGDLEAVLCSVRKTHLLWPCSPLCVSYFLLALPLTSKIKYSFPKTAIFSSQTLRQPKPPQSLSSLFKSFQLKPQWVSPNWELLQDEGVFQ